MTATLNLLAARTEPWMSNPDRNCANTDRADEWFPALAEGEDARRQNSQARRNMARALCWGCPVANECLTYALANDEKHGIWAGTTPRERRTLREGARRELV